MKANPVRSFFTYVFINTQRVIDHSWRRLTGLPTLSRSEITSNVFLGGQYGLRALPFFKKIGVTGIVNMRTRSIHKEKEVQGFHLLHLPTKDFHAPTLENLKKGVDFIQNEIKNGGKVYIHCRLGEGRGATMTLAYLMSTGMTLDDSLQTIRAVRRFIHPTQEQLDQLKKFAKTLN